MSLSSTRSPPALSPPPRPKPGILAIRPYVGGRSRIQGVADPVKLSSNENILGSSPYAREAYIKAADHLHLYPDGRAEGLREAVAAAYALDPDRLIFGCGSDELFTLLAQAYCEPGDNVVQGEYGFLAYRIAALGAGAQVRFAREPGLRIDVEALLEAVDERTRIVFVANPANPTGGFITKAEVFELHARLPQRVLLVLDGAYAEFADGPDFDGALSLAAQAPNIVVTRTFSKIHGLAALRVGWGYGPKEVVDVLERIRGPFNVSLPAQAAATAALADAAFVARSQDHVRTWRPWLAEELKSLGLQCPPSLGNFVLIRMPGGAGPTAPEAEEALARRGILVRGLAGYGLEDCLRITIGLEAHNRAVVGALLDLLAPNAAGP
jgi:histidinol-phosphate aminotransferase